MPEAVHRPRTLPDAHQHHDLNDTGSCRLTYTEASSRGTPAYSRRPGACGAARPRSAAGTSRRPAWPGPGRGARICGEPGRLRSTGPVPGRQVGRLGSVVPRPPLRAISRDTVEAERPRPGQPSPAQARPGQARPGAIVRAVHAGVIPRDISSSSDPDRCRSRRRRAGGRTPPEAASSRLTFVAWQPSDRAISRLGSPRRRRLHNSSVWSAENITFTSGRHHHSQGCVDRLRSPQRQSRRKCATGARRLQARHRVPARWMRPGPTVDGRSGTLQVVGNPSAVAAGQ